jgi:hypothetical protein
MANVGDGDCETDKKSDGDGTVWMRPRWGSVACMLKSDGCVVIE